MKSKDEMKALHGEQYVKNFEYQSPNRLGQLLKHIQLHDNAKVVDFGCGNGMLMDHIAHKVKFYTGVDFSEPFIAAANRRKSNTRADNVSFFCADIEEFCKDRTAEFDIAFAMDFSEHVYDEEWSKIIAGIRDCLAPKGILYLHTPNANFILEMMKARNFLIRQFPEHIAVRSPEQNIVLLRRAGFNNITVMFLPHYNFLRFLDPLSALPVIGKYFQARLLIRAMK